VAGFSQGVISLSNPKYPFWQTVCLDTDEPPGGEGTLFSLKSPQWELLRYVLGY